MSKKVVYENPSELQQFENSQLGVSCAITGEIIDHEQGIIYARNADEARNGFGICKEAYEAFVDWVSEPESEKDDSEGDPKGKNESKTPPPPVTPVKPVDDADKPKSGK